MSKMHKSKRKRGGNTISMKADLNKDGVLSDYEKARGSAIQESMKNDG